MERNELFTGVIECVSESLAKEPSKITPATSLIRDLGADSLDFMDIMFSLEKKFGVELDKEDFDLITRTKMKKEEAIENGNLTAQAKIKLREWLPNLPETDPVPARDLGSFITIETLVRIIEDFKPKNQPSPAA